MCNNSFQERNHERFVSIPFISGQCVIFVNSLIKKVLMVSIPFISGQCVIGIYVAGENEVRFQSPLYQVNV